MASVLKTKKKSNTTAQRLIDLLLDHPLEKYNFKKLSTLTLTQLKTRYNYFLLNDSLIKRRVRQTLHAMKGKRVPSPAQQYTTKHSKTIFYA